MGPSETHVTKMRQIYTLENLKFGTPKMELWFRWCSFEIKADVRFRLWIFEPCFLGPDFVWKLPFQTLWRKVWRGRSLGGSPGSGRFQRRFSWKKRTQGWDTPVAWVWFSWCFFLVAVVNQICFWEPRWFCFLSSFNHHIWGFLFFFVQAPDKQI